jgi:hypothetical protein
MLKIISAELGEAAIENGVALRDISGRLAFFLANTVDELRFAELEQKLSTELGSYARTDRVLVRADAFGAEGVLADRSRLVVDVEGRSVKLLERRLVGADWLRRPSLPAPPPPRFVFASLKGGVGRSTALAVTAAHLASKGRRVLAIDLDMEAPGLGALLLNPATLPEFGLVDALIENSLSSLDNLFIADLVGPSALADRMGRIDVVPAFGRRSLDNPADVLSKLASAYAEDVKPDGTVATLLDQVREIVDRLTDQNRYDAILIDSRAGLHETTASAILGLGAEVFLFGLDEEQTFQGYAYLFAHLARFRNDSSAPEWLDRLTMVQGKAPADAARRTLFAERCQDLFEQTGLSPRGKGLTEVPLPAAPFGDVPWRDDDDEISDDELLPLGNIADREALAILDDTRYQNFSPLNQKDLLQIEIYRSSFGIFLDRIDTAFRPATREAI